MTSSRQTAGSQHTAAASSRSPCPADDSRKFIRLETTMHHSPYVATSPQQQALVRLAVYALHLGAPQSAACRLSSLYPVESPPHVGGCGSASRTARIAGCRWTGVHSRMGYRAQPRSRRDRATVIRFHMEWAVYTFYTCLCTDRRGGQR